MSHKHFTLLERIKLEGFLDEKIPIVVCAKKLYINKKKRKERQLEKGIDNRPKIVVKRQRIGDVPKSCPSG